MITVVHAEWVELEQRIAGLFLASEDTTAHPFSIDYYSGESVGLPDDIVDQVLIPPRPSGLKAMEREVPVQDPHVLQTIQVRLVGILITADSGGSA